MSPRFFSVSVRYGTKFLFHIKIKGSSLRLDRDRSSSVMNCKSAMYFSWSNETMTVCSSVFRYSMTVFNSEFGFSPQLHLQPASIFFLQSSLFVAKPLLFLFCFHTLLHPSGRWFPLKFASQEALHR